MSWTLLVALVVLPALGVAALLARRAELRRMRERLDERERVRLARRPADLLQHPVVDLSRCLGCATCVAACPEEGVLDVVHGQAMVVDGGRCVGVQACERECPVDAITVTVADLDERRDVPALTDGLESTTTPGLFLAGEVTAHALIRTAVEHGTAVARAVDERRAEGATATAARSPGADGAVGAASGAPAVDDLLIVGAGPAGLACALEAKRRGLAFRWIDQEERPGGTVAKYPRRKLVLTRPLDLPLVGRLRRTTWEKEELVALWDALVEEHALPLACGTELLDVSRDEDGVFTARTGDGERRARHVCLALGRRGTPNRLDVPGEDLPKVAYSLLDAQSFSGRRVAVVGGGDSAAEAALALAEQPGNAVTLAYRGHELWRLKASNAERLGKAERDGRVEVVRGAVVRAIRPDAVELLVRAADDDVASVRRLPNDEVFVMAGGKPPVELLERAGVSFDPADRAPAEPVVEQGTGLLRALTAAGALALVALLFAVWNADYYLLPRVVRPEHGKHELLRPSLGLGLWLGIASVGLILVNLAYLVRRASWGVRIGSLRAWMTSHVATGVLAVLCAMLHAGMAPRNTVGGHAFLALTVLLVTGAVGRYLYAWVPRAANGRELDLAEVRARLALDEAAWPVDERRFRERAREEVAALAERRQWGGGLAGRLLALVGLRRDLSKVLRDLRARGAADGVDPVVVDETCRLARRAHRSAVMAAHFEDLRGLLATWRWVHRWVALLMVLLLALHIVFALKYSVTFYDETTVPEIVE